jgi:hypothetical protein
MVGVNAKTEYHVSRWAIRLVLRMSTDFSWFMPSETHHCISFSCQDYAITVDTSRLDVELQLCFLFRDFASFAFLAAENSPISIIE